MKTFRVQLIPYERADALLVTPPEIVEQLGLHPGTYVVVDVGEESLTIRKATEVEVTAIRQPNG